MMDDATRSTPSEVVADTAAAAPRRRDVDKVARVASVFAVLGIFVVCALLAALQLAERGRVEVSHEPARTTPSDEPADQVPAAPSKTSLVEVLPVSVDGFRTSARHDVPGFEGEMAEAIFTPLAEEVSIRTPLNCYVVVRSAEGAAADEFTQVAERYPERSEPAGVAGIETEQSFVWRDRSTYMVGWVASDHVVLVDARFTMATPQDAGEVLEFHAVAVVQAVAERIGR